MKNTTVNVLLAASALIPVAAVLMARGVGL